MHHAFFVAPLILASCGDASEAPRAETREAAPPRATPEPQARALPPIPEADAGALLDTWLRAQNEGRFEDYERLYASRFEGVKRSGDRTRRFDREGFLADRRRMFARPMEAAARDVEVRTTPTTAIVRFEQRWASATYRDVGPKEMLLVREGSELRIAREEMLASVVEGRGPAASLGPPGSFFFTVEAGGLYVVVHPQAAEAWSEGRLAIVDRSDYVAIVRPAKPTAIPRELAALVGHEVRVHGDLGEVCHGRLGELRVLRRVRPHFGTIQYWDGELGTPPVSPDAIAAEAWELYGEGGALVAKVEGSGECEGALWARSAESPAPPNPRMAPASSAGEAAILEAVRATRGYREAGRGNPVSWPWELSEGATMRILVSGAPGPRSAFAELHAGRGCGDFLARLLVPLEERRGAWITRSAPDEPFTYLASFDLDGDGSLEHLVELEYGRGRMVLRRVGDAYVAAASVAYPYRDCPC